MGRVAVVTGATAGYADLLGELLLNFSHLSVFDFADVHVFDIDFTAEQVTRFRRYPVNVQRIEQEPLPISCPDPQRRHIVSTIRPKMRDVFPGYEIYVYLDVDVWLQDRSALDGLVAGAADKALVLVPENPAIYGNAITAPWQRKHEKFYGKEVASRMIGRTNWNGGIVALHCDSPAWDIWGAEYRVVVDRSGEWFGGAQSAFTYLDMIGAVEILSLPPVYNWLVAYAPPCWDDRSRHFVSPGAPHEKILLVHQNHKSKSRRYRVRCSDGSSVVTGFRYPDYLVLRGGTREKTPWWRRPWRSAGHQAS